LGPFSSFQHDGEPGKLKLFHFEHFFVMVTASFVPISPSARCAKQGRKRQSVSGIALAEVFMRFNKEHPMFVIQNWQRLYAEALLEADPDKLPRKIMLAENSIATRVLELCGEHSMPNEENFDLARAVDELIGLLLQLSSISVAGPPFQPNITGGANSKMNPNLTIHFANVAS
jgi:hypothetical protein